MDESSIKARLDDAGVLGLGGAELRDADLERWDMFSWLARVRTLDVSKNELTDAGLARLVGLGDLRGLVRLDLHSNELGPRAAELLAASTVTIKNLRELELGSNELGDSSAALAEAEAVTTLEHLGLAWTGLGAAGLSRLIRSTRLAALRHLDIRGAPVGPAAIREFAEAPALAGLEVLDFSDNDLGPDAVGDDDVELLLRSRALPSLRTIVLLPRRIWGSGAEVDVVAWRARLGPR